uniref:Uncharacterized protein n=2 Tax=Oryza punctata TaxID=4537 RepID=A0A0E0LZN4_ORYPU
MVWWRRRPASAPSHPRRCSSSSTSCHPLLPGRASCRRPHLAQIGGGGPRRGGGWRRRGARDPRVGAGMVRSLSAAATVAREKRVGGDGDRPPAAAEKAGNVGQRGNIDYIVTLSRVSAYGFDFAFSGGKPTGRAPKPEVISSVAFRRTASERGRGRVRQHGRRADSRDLTDRSNRGVVRKQSLRVPRGKQYEEYGGEWRRRRWRVVRRVFWSSPCRALAVWRNTLVNVVISAPNLK